MYSTYFWCTLHLISVLRSCVPAFTVAHFAHVAGVLEGSVCVICGDVFEGRVYGCVYDGGWCGWVKKSRCFDVKSGQWTLT